MDLKGNDNIDLTPKLRVNSSIALKELTIEGVGISKILSSEVADAIDKGDLIDLLPTYPRKEIDIYVHYRTHEESLPKITCFLSFMLAKQTA